MNDLNTGDFFVMLNTPNGGYTQLEKCLGITNNTSEIAKFKTKELAVSGALGSVLGSEFGYEVFQIGCGE